METTIIGLGFGVVLGLYSRPSDAVPCWVWYGFWVRILIRTPKKVRLDLRH